jgi:GTPase
MLTNVTEQPTRASAPDAQGGGALERGQARRRAQAGESAVLVALEFPRRMASGTREQAHAAAAVQPVVTYDETLEEFRLLVQSAGVAEDAFVGGKRQSPDPALFVGSGKCEEIRQVIDQHSSRVVIFNHALSPAQQRNLERNLQATVIDRPTLILDIFAQRAQSHEGKLQVELAQLKHLSTRLVRGWTHLERQKGGIGLRGPGETQLESDRRMIGTRIQALQKQLAKVERQRSLQRRARQRNGVFAVSLVGYTNAGKSTLFNALTRAGAYAADRLFATLDTTSRRINLSLPVVGKTAPVVLSDTVGFIRDLPTPLIAAFRATLEETVQADLLLHVADAASPTRDDQVSEVNAVLREIGAGHLPQLMVWNKIDLIEGRLPAVTRDASGMPEAVALSARTRDGLELLRSALGEHMAQDGSSGKEGHEQAHKETVSDPDEALEAPESVTM